MDLLQRIASFVVVPNLIAALIGLPSALLYLLEVFIVWACRGQQQFNSSFFHLFIVRALPNIFNMLTSYWGLRFGLLNMFFPVYQQMPKWLFNFFFFTSYYTYHVENLATTMLLLNRLTSILFALSYEKVWRHLIIFADLIIFVLPLIFTWPIFEAELDVHYFDSSNTSFGILSVNSAFPCSDFVAHSGATFLLICMLLSIATWLAYRRKFARFNATVDQQQLGLATGMNRIEMLLLIYAFSTFLCQFITTSLYYGIYLATIKYDSSRMARLFVDLLFNNFGLINDICTVVVPAWLMLFSCAKMREIFRLNLKLLKRWLKRKLPKLPSTSEKIHKTGGCIKIEGRLYCENNFVIKK